MSWRRRQRELDEELQSHLALAAESHREHGAAHPEKAAEREFGNYDLVAETTRAQWGAQWVASLRRDVALAWRDLWHHRGYALSAVLVFALAMSAFAAVYELADAIYFHPLPYVPRQEQLAWFERVNQNQNAGEMAPAEFQALADSVDPRGAWSSVAAFREANAVLTDNTPRQIQAAFVSGDFFSLLGVRPVLGRLLGAADEQPGRRVLLLSYGLWQERFGGARSVLGQTVHLGGEAYTVIGVMGEEFDFNPGVGAWLPLAFTPLDWSTTWGQIRNSSPGSSLPGTVEVVGRLRPGAAWRQANAALAALSAHLPETGETAPLLRAEPIRQRINGNRTPMFMTTLLAAMLFLLLLACANVANLNLARTAARRHELAVRAALGASGLRLVQAVLVEALLLALLGGAAGVGAGRPLLHLLHRVMPRTAASQIVGLANVGLNPRVFLDAFLLCALAGVLSGLLPAWNVLRGRECLAGGSRTGTPAGGDRGRQLLMGAQTALAVILLAGTALMFTSFEHFADAIGQFQPDPVVTFHLSLQAPRYAAPAERARFYKRLLESLSALTGVQSAVAYTSPPFTGNEVRWSGYFLPPDPARRHGAVYQAVSPGFLRAFRVPLLQGRALAATDDASAPPVALVSAELARSAWPGQSALGRHIRIGNGGAWLTVVGVAGGVEYDWTDDGAEPAIYVPLAQAAPVTSIIALRSATAPSALLAEARAAVAPLDPQLPLLAPATLRDVFAAGLAPIYALGYMLGALGLVAMVLALAGLYGVTAYNANRRLRELGIRAALGARSPQLTRLVLGQCLLAAVVGAGLGAVGALELQGAAASFFYGVRPGDCWPLAGATALLLGAALLASYLPARRAGAGDPMMVLRED